MLVINEYMKLGPTVKIITSQSYVKLKTGCDTEHYVNVLAINV